MARTHLRPFQGQQPELGDGAYVDPAAVVIGRVSIGAGSSIWPGAVVRGDVNYIRIGARTSIQDGTVIHVTHDHDAMPGGAPTVIGDEVTVGHNCTLHGCRIEERCLIGMGATLLDGAVVESETIVGAGALVPPGKRLEGGWLWLGAPVERKRRLTEAELAGFRYSAENYVRLAAAYRDG